MTGRSTSWFDRGELKALFKGVRPARGRRARPRECRRRRLRVRADGARAPARRVRRALRAAGRPPSPPAEPPSDDAPARARRPREAGAECRWRVRPRLPDARADTSADPGRRRPLRGAPRRRPTPATGGRPRSGQPDRSTTPPAGPDRSGGGATRRPARVPAPPTPDPTSEALWRQSEALLHLARGQAATQALEERLWEITETAASVLSLARASVWTFETRSAPASPAPISTPRSRDAHESGQAAVRPRLPALLRGPAQRAADRGPRREGRSAHARARGRRPRALPGAHRGPGVRGGAPGGGGATRARRLAPSLRAPRGALRRLPRRPLPASPSRPRSAGSRRRWPGWARSACAPSATPWPSCRGASPWPAAVSRACSSEVTEAAVRVLRAGARQRLGLGPRLQEPLLSRRLRTSAAARHDRGAEIDRGAGAPLLRDARGRGRGSPPPTPARSLGWPSCVRERPRALRASAPASRRRSTSWARLAGVLWCERAGSPRSWLADEERFAEALAGFVALEHRDQRAASHRERAAPGPRGPRPHGAAGSRRKRRRGTVTRSERPRRLRRGPGRRIGMSSRLVHHWVRTQHLL